MTDKAVLISGQPGWTYYAIMPLGDLTQGTPWRALKGLHSQPKQLRAMTSLIRIPADSFCVFDHILDDAQNSVKQTRTPFTAEPSCGPGSLAISD